MLGIFEEHSLAERVIPDVRCIIGRDEINLFKRKRQCIGIVGYIVLKCFYSVLFFGQINAPVRTLYKLICRVAVGQEISYLLHELLSRVGPPFYLGNAQVIIARFKPFFVVRPILEYRRAIQLQLVLKVRCDTVRQRLGVQRVICKKNAAVEINIGMSRCKPVPDCLCRRC